MLPTFQGLRKPGGLEQSRFSSSLTFFCAWGRERGTSSLRGEAVPGRGVPAPSAGLTPSDGVTFPPRLPADKCITSELLKDIPLPGVLGGSLSAEAELLKGGENWLRDLGGPFSYYFPPPLPPLDTIPLFPPSLQAHCLPRRNLSMGTSKPSRSIVRKRMGAR